MTSLDDLTMIIVSTVAFAVPTVTFCILTATRYNDPAGRLWSVGPIALCAALTAVATEPGHLERALDAVVAGCLVFSVGAVWSGLRTHLDRDPPHVVGVLGGTALTILVSIAWPAATNGLTGAVVVVGAGLVLIELATARGRRTERILMRLGNVGLLAWGAAAIVLAFSGSDVTGHIDDAETVVAFTAAQGVTLMALTTLRVQAATDLRTVPVDPGFLPRDVFIAQGVDRLQRAANVGVRSQFFVVFPDGLDVVEAAYGRAAVGVAIDHVSSVVRDKVPASALIARLEDGQLAVLTTSSRHTGPEDIIEAIETGLASTPAPDRLPLRIDVSVRVATGDPTPALLRAATEPLAG